MSRAVKTDPVIQHGVRGDAIPSRPRSTRPRSFAAAAGQDAKAQALSLWVVAFIVSLLVPIQIYVGDIRLSFYRVVLLLSFVPVVMRLFSTKTKIRFRAPDFFMILYALTGMTALIFTVSSVSSMGIFFLEAAGPFFLARAYIQTSGHFTRSMSILVACIIATLPFAIYESITQNPILITLLGKLFPVISNVPHETRLGLDRAQVTFDHPILFGVFSSMGLTFAIYATRARRPVQRTFRKGGVVGLTAFFSLSSGAFVSIGLQAALICYDVLFRRFPRRWTVLALSFAATYLFVELASNRTVPEISIRFLALNPSTAWTRLNVNEWAMQAILADPWFGFGGKKMPPPPPPWVNTTSIDNFWLAIAFQHGLPTLGFLLLTVLSIIVTVIRTKQEDDLVNACRTAFIITLVAICVTVVTVHLWNSTYVAFMFLLGSGLWMGETQPGPDKKKPVQGTDEASPGEIRAPIYRRDRGS